MSMDRRTDEACYGGHDEGGQRGTKKVRQRLSGNKTQISVLACGNAVGQAIPPMVIFAGKNFNYELSDGEVPETV